jgi:hypothetical protein
MVNAYLVWFKISCVQGTTLSPTHPTANAAMDLNVMSNVLFSMPFSIAGASCEVHGV